MGKVRNKLRIIEAAADTAADANPNLTAMIGTAYAELAANFNGSYVSS
jgi:hypothetical protein